MKYATYDIVFQEFPDEVTLAINLTECPCHCPGCHSPYLSASMGDVLTWERLSALIAQYEGGITCVALMGGDADPSAVAAMLRRVREAYPRLHTGWYSGREALPEGFTPEAFDYVKLGPWRAECGPLKERTTNQRLYRYHADGSRIDITHRFWR